MQVLPRRLFLLAAAIGSALGFCDLASAQTATAAQTNTQLTIAVSGDTLIYLPLYVARAGGFFEKEGVDVRWVNVGSASRQGPAVIGGSADITPLAMFHMINAQIEGLPLVAISDLFDAPALQVVLSKASLQKTGINPSMPIDEKVSRLRGLRIGTSAPGSGTETTFRKVLQSRGHNPEELLLLQPLGGSGPTLAAFEKGLVEGVVYPAPVPEIIESKGIGTTVIDGFNGELPELARVPFLTLATSRDTIKNKPELLMKTLRALASAMTFAQQNPAKIPALLRPYFKDLDEAVYERMATSYLKGAAKTPMIGPDQVDATAKWMSIGTDRTYRVNYEDVVATGLLKQALGASRN